MKLLRGPPGRHPAGRIINNKTGTDITWKSKGYAFERPGEGKLRPGGREAGTASRRAGTKPGGHRAARVGRQMADLVPIEQPTPYLQAKGIGRRPA